MKTLIYYLFIGIFLIFQEFEVVRSEDAYDKISSYNEGREYVNPHSFYYDRSSKGIRQPLSDKSKVIGVESFETDITQKANEGVDCSQCPYEAFTKRIINIMLSNANLKEEDGHITGGLRLDMTSEELKAIKGFSSGEYSFRQIDAIVSKVIQPVPSFILDDALTFTEQLSISIYQHRIICGAILLITFVVMLSIKVRWTRGRIILLILDIMLIISFSMTWFQLIQEAQAKSLANHEIYSQLPDECRQNEISSYKSILLFFGFGKGECEKYYQTMISDVAYDVTPMHVFTHMISKMVMYPISQSGSYIAEFVHNVTGQLPFLVRYTIAGVMIFTAPLFIIILLVVAFGGSTGMSLGFIEFYLRGREATPPPTYSSNSKIAINGADAGLNAVEGPFDQQIREIKAEPRLSIKNTLKTAVNSSKQIAVSLPKKKSNGTKDLNTRIELKNSAKKIKRQQNSVESDEKKESTDENADENTDESIEDTDESDTLSDNDFPEVECKKVNVDQASGDARTIKCCENTEKMETPKKIKRKRKSTSVEVGSGDS